MVFFCKYKINTYTSGFPIVGKGIGGASHPMIFFENPLLKLMPPMGHLLPHLKMKSSKLKNKPPPIEK